MFYIPNELRKDILCLIYQGHFREVRNQSRAHVCACTCVCVFRNNDGGQASSFKIVLNTEYRINSEEPLLKFKIPKRPWERLGEDVLEHHGKQYLVLQDYFSKFIKLLELNKSLLLFAIIHKMKGIFSRHGIAIVVVLAHTFHQKNLSILLRNIIFIVQISTWNSPSPIAKEKEQ